VIDFGGMEAYEYIMIAFACLSFKQHVFCSSLRDDKKDSLRSIFYLSLGKNIGAALSRSTAKAIMIYSYAGNFIKPKSRSRI